MPPSVNRAASLRRALCAALYFLLNSKIQEVI